MPIRNQQELQQAIKAYAALEQLQRQQLIGKYRAAAKSLQPLQLLKSTLLGVTNSPEIVDQITGAGMGLGAGYLTKKAVFGQTRNPIKLLLGNLLEMGVGTAVAQHAGDIRNTLMLAFGKWLNMQKSSKNKA